MTPKYWNASGNLVDASTINDTLSGNLGRAAGENVSTYAFNLGSVAANTPANYITSLTAATFAITPAALTVIANAGQSKVYGTNDSAGGFTYGNTGLVNGVTPKYWNASGNLIDASTINDTLSGNLGRAAGENVSTYAFNLGSVTASAPSNYLTSLTAGTFAITPAALTVIANAGQSKVYGTSDAAGGFTYGNTGLVNGVTPKYWNASGNLVDATTINDTLSGNLGRAAGENVSTYAFNLGSVAANTPSNYLTSLTAATFAITPAALTIIADLGQSKIYGTNDTASGFTYGNTGLVNGVTPKYWNASGNLVDATTINDTLSGNLGRAAGENVSTYAFNLGNVAASTPSNYLTSLTAATFAITPAALTIIADLGQSKVYGTNDTAGGFTYGNTGLVNGVTPKYWNASGNLVDSSTISDTLSGKLGRAVGENVSTYSYNLGSVAASTPSNYLTSLTAGTFAITPAALIVTADAGQNKVYGTNDTASGFTYGNTGLVNGVTPKYWNASGNLVDATTINDTLSGNLGRAAGENVSTYAYNLGSVGVSIPSNYLTSLAAGTFAITPAALTLTADIGQSKVYGTNDTASGFTYNNTGLVNGVTPKYWNASGNLVDGSTINDTLSGNLGRAAGENVSTYAFNVGSVAANVPSNYLTSLIAGTFAITPASLVVTANAGQSKVYGTNDTASGFVYGNTGLVNGVTPKYWNASGNLVDGSTINDTLSGKLGRAAGENVNNYSYNLGSVAANVPSNYLTSLIAGTFAITPAALTITANAGQNKVYGTNDTAGGFAYGNTGLVNGVTPKYWDASGNLVNASTINDTLSGKLGRAAGENVSAYAYNLGNVGVSVPSNYLTSLIAGTFAITPAALTITANAGQNKVYGTNDTASGYTYGNTGLVNGVTPKYWDASGNLVNATTINDTVSGNLGRAAGENVSTYAYNLGSVAANVPSNYLTSLIAGTFAITPAALTITADAGQSKVYGTNDTASGFTYGNTGLVNGVTPKYWNASGNLVNASTINDTLSGNLGRAVGENVNNYAYNLGGVSANVASNYITSLTAGTFAITPASLTIIPIAGQNKVYGMSNPVYAYTNTGLVNNVTPKYWNASGNYVNDATINDTLNGNLVRAAGENVGNYAYNIGSVVVNTPANYNVAMQPNSFAITPATLTLVANDANKIYGQSNPAFGGIVTGFVNGESQASATTGTLSFTSAATANSNVGNYSVVGSGLTANFGNYIFAQATNNAIALSISPASLIVNGIIANNKVFNGTTAATLNFAAATLSGVLGSDVVNINPNSYIANFVTANPGNNLPVTVSNLGVTGTSANNYILIQPNNLIANIAPLSLVPVPPAEVIVPPLGGFLDSGVVFPTNYTSAPQNATNNATTSVFITQHPGKSSDWSTKVVGSCISEVFGGNSNNALITICSMP